MPRLPRRLLVLAISMVGVLSLVSACTDAQTPPASPPSAAANTPSGHANTTAQDRDAVTISIVIKDGNVSPNGDKMSIRKGDTIALLVTSDSDDEIHAHTGEDGYELEVRAGIPATGEFVAVETGSFEVESHRLEKTIVILNVR